jgi:hypothetical protein
MLPGMAAALAASSIYPFHLKPRAFSAWLAMLLRRTGIVDLNVAYVA